MKRLMFTLSAAFFLAACTATNSQMHLTKAPTQPYKGYAIKDISNPQVDPKVRSIFMNALNKRLAKLGYKQGQDLNINYNIQIFDEGNRALRYFVGFGAGKAQTNIITKLTTKLGKAVGEIKTTADLKIGLFGGDATQIIENAAANVADEIAKYNLLEPNY